MIIEALTKRRNEMTAQIQRLKTDVMHLDATIRLFASDNKPQRMKHGGLTRTLFNALRSADKPMDTRELSEATGIDAKRVGITLNAHAKKGLVRFVRGEGGCNVWEKI